MNRKPPRQPIHERDLAESNRRLSAFLEPSDSIEETCCHSHPRLCSCGECVHARCGYITAPCAACLQKKRGAA